MATGIKYTYVDTKANMDSWDGTLESGAPTWETDTKNLKVHDGSTAHSSLGYFLPPGMMAPYATTSAPDGWLACDGSAVSRTTYAALFDAIGTTWGVGDGSTTFNLPDLQGAFLRGTGSHGSETDAEGNAYSGPSVGSFQDDQMQQITGEITGVWAAGQTSTGAFSDSQGAGSRPDNDGTGDHRTFAFDSANSPNARTGDETRPFNAGVQWIIKT
jgi:microcystin-dependent protein